MYDFIIELANELTPSEKKVLNFIIDNEGENGLTLSNEEISKNLNDMPIKQVQTVINSLTNMEYIVRKNNAWSQGFKYRRILSINKNFY